MATDPANSLHQQPSLDSLKGGAPFIGLTGGVGSGKTAVSDMLAQLGAGVVDTDQIAHQITSPNGVAVPLIKKQFGSDFLDPVGALDRSKMRHLVFANPEARKRLEAITHPLIRIESARQAQRLLRKHVPYVVFAVPLLIESGNWRQLIDYLVVVDCLKETQIERVMHRSNLPRNEVEKILEAQANRNERLKSADFIIENQGTLQQLQAEAPQLHQKFLQIGKDRLSSS
ncbi:MAG TPA: dephospho-CoA kinase [Polynucleobacter sp.]|nr:dephospho-CoA kinase [Polynucleobacter sp.]